MRRDPTSAILFLAWLVLAGAALSLACAPKAPPPPPTPTPEPCALQADLETLATGLENAYADMELADTRLEAGLRDEVERLRKDLARCGCGKKGGGR